MEDPQIYIGKHIGDYRLLSQVGQGTFGVVYLAEHVHDNSQSAVKVLHVQLTNPASIREFLNEARTVRLRHPHIMPILDFGLSSQNLPFLAMEYVPGGTLRNHYPKGHQVPLPHVITLTIQVASALQYAHDHRLIHRDVKPENIFCRPDGTVLLGDFGIASVAHSSNSMSNNQNVGGTLPYMAPEQLVGKPQLESDQYALAVVVYEWLAGTRPFQGTMPEIISQHFSASPPSLLQHVPALPEEVEQAIFKALSKRPQDRFSCIQDFATALQEASHHVPLLVPSTSYVRILSAEQRPSLPSASTKLLQTGEEEIFAFAGNRSNSTTPKRAK